MPMAVGAALLLMVPAAHAATILTTMLAPYGWRLDERLSRE